MNLKKILDSKAIKDSSRAKTLEEAEKKASKILNDIQNHMKSYNPELYDKFGGNIKVLPLKHEYVEGRGPMVLATIGYPLPEAPYDYFEGKDDERRFYFEFCEYCDEYPRLLWNAHPTEDESDGKYGSGFQYGIPYGENKSLQQLKKDKYFFGDLFFGEEPLLNITFDELLKQVKDLLNPSGDLYKMVDEYPATIFDIDWGTSVGGDFEGIHYGPMREYDPEEWNNDVVIMPSWNNE